MQSQAELAAARDENDQLRKRCGITPKEAERMQLQAELAAARDENDQLRKRCGFTPSLHLPKYDRAPF